VIIPVFKTGGRRLSAATVGSTPTRFRHNSLLNISSQVTVYAGLTDLPYMAQRLRKRDVSDRWKSRFDPMTDGILVNGE